MPKINYVPKRFAASSYALIADCNAIIADYQAQGYSLTLRQLYYRLVAADKVENTQKSYDRVGAILNDARLAGLVDWDAIEDRTRYLSGISHFGSPESVVAAAHDSYRLDKWKDQPTCPEVWVEKEALAGVVARAANRNDVGYFSCRGYASVTAMQDAAQRFLNRARLGQKTVIIHLGDHDPSGIDMTRDIDDRLRLFMEYHAPGSGAFVQRIALNMPQIEQYEPPPNPAKTTDSRYGAYAAEYGDESWELDALEPAILDALIDDEIKRHRDDERYSAQLREEAKGRAQLAVLSANFAQVAATLDADEVAVAEDAEIDAQENPDEDEY